MASTSTQNHESLASAKEQGNNINVIEPGTNFKECVTVKSRKRKASGDIEENPKKHRLSSDGTKNSNTCDLSNVSVDDVRVEPGTNLKECAGGKSRKRKASGDIKENPKKHRESIDGTKNSNTCDLSNVSVDDVRVGSRKRKASPDNERPNKRHRDGSNTEAGVAYNNKSVRVSEEDVSAGQRNCNIGGETSKKRQEESECRQSFPKASSSIGQTEKTLPTEADFEEKYELLDLIGEGGYGLVYSGIRNADSFPVAIKFVQYPEVPLDIDIHKIPREVALMQRAAGGPESVGKCAAVSLLDWYYIDQKLVLVMERPDPSMDLRSYMSEKGGTLEEHEAKILMAQLVEAAIEMHRKRVFHRDIKQANILVDVSSSIPRVRIIDFGCGCFVQKQPYLRFIGTFELAPPEWHMHKKYKAAPTTVWQLGALLYRMLHPSNLNTLGFIGGHIHISTDLSKDCREFLQLCLAINPKERVTLKQLPLQPWLK